MTIKRKLVVAGSAAILALSAMSPASATSAFSNDFESGAFAGTGFQILPNYEGWTADTAAGIEVQYGNVAGFSYSGTHHVELDSNANASMSRVLADAGSYVLSFYYSDRPNVGAGSNGIDVFLGLTNILSIPGGNGAAQTVWTLKTVNVNLLGGEMLRFIATGTSDSLGGYLDDISLATAAVPEPTTWAMMIVGLGVAGIAMRRRATKISFA